MLLDAECAWWGDPAFDLAFCLNHLLLKCLWNAGRPRDAFLAAFDALADAYLQGVDWEPRDALERRAAALLPGLFLARVDGKSPVEYITDDAQRERGAACRRRVAAATGRSPAAIAATPGARNWFTMAAAMNAREHPFGARAARVGQPRPADRRGRGARCDDGAVGRAIVPAGASKGTREALELRDGGRRFGGLDVHARRRQRQRRDRARASSAWPADDQAALDQRLIELDGTPTSRGSAPTRRSRCRWPRRMPRRRRSAVPLYAIPRRARRDAAADAADPDLRRRRARRPPRRHPGLHGRLPRRARSFAQALEWTAEVYRTPAG